MSKAYGILGFGLVLLGLSSPALAQTPLGIKDIERITATAKSNEIRFKRDYQGKPFQAILPVNSISENFIFKDQYTATFGKNIFSNNVTCKVSDKPTRSS